MNWNRVRRIVTVLAALAVAVGVGLAIAEFVILTLGSKVGPIEDEYEVGTFIALVGIMLLIFKDSLLAIVNIWSYVWKEDGSPPKPSESAVWLIEAIVAATRSSHSSSCGRIGA